jgi:hypothetical protein
MWTNPAEAARRREVFLPAQRVWPNEATAVVAVERSALRPDGSPRLRAARTLPPSRGKTQAVKPRNTLYFQRRNHQSGSGMALFPPKGAGLGEYELAVKPNPQPRGCKMGPELKEFVKQLERERDSMLLAARTFAKKFDETAAPTFRRMAARAVERAAKVQREIQKLKTNPN